MAAQSQGIDSLLTWSRVARGAIALFLVVTLLLVAAHLWLLFTELTTDTGLNIGLYSPVLAVVLVASNLLLSVVFLIAAVPIAGWIYRAHANLHEAGVNELTYSPGWSLGSFFVPLLNFVVPFRAMRELHNRSHGEGPWQARSAVADVTSWWSCHIAALGVAAVAMLVALLATVPNLYVVQPPGVNTGLMLFALLLLTGSGWFLFRTIGAVTRAQQHMLHLNHTEVFA
jgi:hypothetical protein